MHDYKKVFEIINENTFIENVNKGIVQPPDFFGATKSEGMAYSKCTMCYLEDELLEFYNFKKLLDSPPPIININFKNFNKKITELYKNPKLIISKGKESRKFVEKYHSYQAIGKKFDKINKIIL